MFSYPNSDCTTHGVRVRAKARFVATASEPDKGRYFFVYQIRIENDGDATVQLLSRRWTIVDGNHCREEVEGDGVVGKQPILRPGESFEYQSYCPLRTTWGTMEGTYTFIDEAGGSFEAAVERFFLLPEPAPAALP